MFLQHFFVKTGNYGIPHEQNDQSISIVDLSRRVFHVNKLFDLLFRLASPGYSSISRHFFRPDFNSQIKYDHFLE